MATSDSSNTECYQTPGDSSAEQHLATTLDPMFKTPEATSDEMNENGSARSSLRISAEQENWSFLPISKSSFRGQESGALLKELIGDIWSSDATRNNDQRSSPSEGATKKQATLQRRAAIGSWNSLQDTSLYFPLLSDDMLSRTPVTANGNVRITKPGPVESTNFRTPSSRMQNSFVDSDTLTKDRQPEESHRVPQVTPKKRRLCNRIDDVPPPPLLHGDSLLHRIEEFVSTDMRLPAVTRDTKETVQIRLLPFWDSWSRNSQPFKHGFRRTSTCSFVETTNAPPTTTKGIAPDELLLPTL